MEHTNMNPYGNDDAGDDYEDDLVCVVCHEKFVDRAGAYCPNCGWCINEYLVDPDEPYLSRDLEDPMLVYFTRAGVFEDRITAVESAALMYAADQARTDGPEALRDRAWELGRQADHPFVESI